MTWSDTAVEGLEVCAKSTVDAANIAGNAQRGSLIRENRLALGLAAEQDPQFAVLRQRHEWLVFASFRAVKVESDQCGTQR